MKSAWVLAATGLVLMASTAMAQTVTTTDASIEDNTMYGREMRAPSPRAFNKDRNDFVQLSAGPAYGLGVISDSFLYNVTGSYNWNFSDRVTVKGLVDLYLGADNSPAQMTNLAAGADFYFTEGQVYYTVPYLSFEIGAGNARTSDAEKESGLTVGTGAGLKFLASDLNWDLNLHYSLLTRDIRDEKPAVFAMRAGVNF